MKRAATWMLLLACVLAGGVHWIDLNSFTDLTTGFVLSGPVWLRYALMAVLLLACAMAARVMGVRRPEELTRRTPAMGAAALLAGLLFAAVGGVRLAGFGRAPGAEKLFCVLCLLTALWLLLAGVSRFYRSIAPPTSSAVWGVLAALSLYLLTVARFGFKPTSLVRIVPTVQVFSALAALLFLNTLSRSLYLPGAPCGRRLYLSGTAAFFLCTCLELPQALAFRRAGLLNGGELLTSAALAGLGLLGAVCALAASGEELPEPAPEQA